MSKQLTLEEKTDILSKWLRVDCRGWTEKKIHSIYNREKTKRARLYYREFFQ